MNLYRKYRPKDFEEVAGEEEIVKSIKNSLKMNKISHAYLFTGPRGVGKTTVARIIAKAVNCKTNGMSDSPCNICENCLAVDKGNFFDLIEIDAASNRGIDEIRALKEKINYKPVLGEKKVYIIDEVHMLTKEAFNALLKTLEEPPSHVIFILATTEPEKILDTIISRCQRYDFLPLSYEDIKKRLLFIAENEKIIIDEESLKIIYEKSGGSARDSISIFEKIFSSVYPENIVLETTEKVLGISSRKELDEFFACIKSKDFEESIIFIDKLWEKGKNIEDFLRDFSNYLKDKALELKESKYINMIEIIFELILKFKYEEDKRLIAYLLISKIFKMSTNQVVIEKIEKTPEVKSNIDDKFIDVLKSKWNEILNNVRKKKISIFVILSQGKISKIEKDTLYIIFSQEMRFHRDSMQENSKKIILQEVIKEMFNLELNVDFILENEYKKSETEDDFLKEVIDFFEGSII